MGFKVNPTQMGKSDSRELSHGLSFSHDFHGRDGPVNNWFLCNLSLGVAEDFL